MRRLLVVVTLLAWTTPTIADAPSLDATLTWMHDKLRDRGKVEYGISQRIGPQKVIIEQSLSWTGDQCVLLYRRSVTTIDDLGKAANADGTSRVPLAEMDPKTATTYSDLCRNREGVSAKCHFIELRSKRGREVVKHEGTGAGRSASLPMILGGAEGELASKMRDALKHAATLCSAKEPEFPR